MEDPEQWRWIWLGAALLFGLGEMATPGAFFLAPFGLGAAAAAAAAWINVPIAGEWAVFVAISLAALIALRPLIRRLDSNGASDGIGSRRLIGRDGVVLLEISLVEPGLVRIDQEEWRADSADRSPIAAGTTVRVAAVEGTRVLVVPSKEHTS